MAKQKRTMSDEHKQAIAAGRSEGAAVKRYLESLQLKGKPGRPVDPARLSQKLVQIDEQLEVEENPLTCLELEQERINIERRLANLTVNTDTEALEAEFIKVAEAYASRKGISYAAFRKVGVPASVLKEAGISRGD